jgi:hypothetical protein
MICQLSYASKEEKLPCREWKPQLEQTDFRCCYLKNITQWRPAFQTVGEDLQNRYLKKVSDAAANLILLQAAF